MANPMDWISAISAMVKAAIEAFKAHFFIGVGRDREKLEGLENAQDAIDRARRARNADSVPAEADQDNRANRR